MSRLVTYSDDASAELAADSEHAASFYKQLFLLHEISIELSRAQSLDDLYRLAVTACLNHLEIDRMGILMIDKERDWMIGTWGTDEVGNVRSEADFAAPMLDDIQEVIREMSTKGKVCVWHDKELYEFSEEAGEISTVGYGWNAALAIWDDEEVIGWIACDNLLNHKPFQTYQSHTLRLFGSLLGEFIKRLHAEEAIKELNDELENRILARTFMLSSAQEELKKVNVQLEQKVLERTALLHEKTNRLQDTLDNLQHTQSQLIEAEKQSAMANLVMGMAHELNTPLGNIKTAASLQPDIFQDLQRALDSGQLSRSKLVESIHLGLESYQIIDLNIIKMADLVAEFKRLSVNENQRDWSEEVQVGIWLGQAVKVAFERFEGLYSAKVSIDVYPEDARASFNTWQMGQVVEDLVLNALEHGFDNQVEDRISIQATVTAVELKIKFEDNGRGVAEDIEGKMFDAFVTSTRDRGSKGLGLNLVFNLITQGMRGEIRHYCPPSGGCGFIVSLPLMVELPRAH
ncbi:sensor histidine kinase [Thaumasiovibrio subtropicus]|uniref:sensor histidine kinase n=1 Tax=Thaumasiovibrio subtropicus TaxID=1891207 RepID=UPI000B361795|nr:ATP-binding protein [Thaumasiovibrio subtropicus]